MLRNLKRKGVAEYDIVAAIEKAPCYQKPDIFPMPYDSSWRSLSRPGAAGDLFQPVLSPHTPRPPFQPEAVDFSPGNAWWFSELCRLSYRKGEEEAGTAALTPSRAELLAGVGFREICFISGSSSQCMLAAVPAEGGAGAYILAFRGSDRFENWLSNLSAIQAKWPGGGMVHYGFKKEFDRVWPMVDECLPKTDVPLFFTGHSLGGAMAILAAARRPPAAVYTYGAPRAGDRTFVRRLSSIPIHQFVCHQDMVPRMPPSRIPFDFHHAGQIYHLSPGDTDSPQASSGRKSPFPRTSPDPGSPTSRFAAAAASLSGLIPGFLTDHSPVNYTLGLCAALSRENGVPECGRHPPAGRR